MEQISSRTEWWINDKLTLLLFSDQPFLAVDKSHDEHTVWLSLH